MKFNDSWSNRRFSGAPISGASLALFLAIVPSIVFQLTVYASMKPLHAYETFVLILLYSFPVWGGCLGLCTRIRGFTEWPRSKKRWRLLAVGLVSVFLSNGGLLLMDTKLDGSIPRPMAAAIVGIAEHAGTSRNYNAGMKVNQGGVTQIQTSTTRRNRYPRYTATIVCPVPARLNLPFDTLEHLKLSQNQYSQIQAGKMQIVMQIGQGALGLPWRRSFTIEKMPSDADKPTSP